MYLTCSSEEQVCNEREKRPVSREETAFVLLLFDRGKTIDGNLRVDIRTPFTSNQLNMITQIQSVLAE